MGSMASPGRGRDRLRGGLTAVCSSLVPKLGWGRESRLGLFRSALQPPPPQLPGVGLVAGTGSCGCAPGPRALRSLGSSHPLDRRWGAGRCPAPLQSWGRRGLSCGASAMEPAAPALTEEDMAEVKKDALENLRVYLCEKIIAERHFDHLRAKKILTREDTEEISCRTSSKKRAGKLLDYLQENPKGLDTLVESIRREKTQSFLIEKITDEVQKLKIVKLEYLKGLHHNSYMPLPPGATNSLSRLDSNECNFSDKLKDGDATVVYHPTGECSTASFYSNNTSLNLPVVEVGRTESSVFSSTPLPGPGDPGAPPLPLEPQSEEEGNSTDMFLPLRSRSFCQQ